METILFSEVEIGQEFLALDGDYCVKIDRIISITREYQDSILISNAVAFRNGEYKLRNFNDSDLAIVD